MLLSRVGAPTAATAHHVNSSSPMLPNSGQANASSPASPISRNASAQPSRGRLFTGVIAMRPFPSERSTVSPAAMPILDNMDFGINDPRGVA